MDKKTPDARVERLRSALLDEAIRAFEDARISGLCAEGAWEIAYGAMRDLDLSCVLAESGETPEALKSAASRGADS